MEAPANFTPDEEADLEEWPLKIFVSIPAKKRIFLSHPETVLLDTSL